MPDREVVEGFQLEFAGYPSTPALGFEVVEDPTDLPEAPHRLNIQWMPTRHCAPSRLGVVFLDGLRLLASDLPPCLFEGTTSDAWASVWFGMEEPHYSVVNGVPLPESVLVVGPPGARCQAYWPNAVVPSQLAIAISIPVGRLPPVWPEATPLFSVHRVDSDGMRRLRLMVRDLFRRAAHDPDTLRDESACAAWAAELIGVVSELLGGAQEDPVPAVVGTGRYLDVLDEIDRRIAERQDRPVRLEEVAAGLRLAPRTVHNIMKMMRGMTLQAYVNVFKMRSARRHLLRAQTCDLVKQAALGQGYTHLGRFAQEYTKFFGEPPSATLARRQR